jgi:hypothetical protein
VPPMSVKAFGREDCPAFFHFPSKRIRRISGQSPLLCYLWERHPVASSLTMESPTGD